MSNHRRHQRAEDMHESAQLTRVEVQLEHIDKNVCSITHDMSDIKSEIREQRERMVRVEESTKQAHKRLDELVSRKKEVQTQ